MICEPKRPQPYASFKQSSAFVSAATGLLRFAMCSRKPSTCLSKFREVFCFRDSPPFYDMTHPLRHFNRLGVTRDAFSWHLNNHVSALTPKALLEVFWTHVCIARDQPLGAPKIRQNPHTSCDIRPSLRTSSFIPWNRRDCHFFLNCSQTTVDCQEDSSPDVCLRSSLLAFCVSDPCCMSCKPPSRRGFSLKCASASSFLILCSIPEKMSPHALHDTPRRIHVVQPFFFCVLLSKRHESVTHDCACAACFCFLFERLCSVRTKLISILPHHVLLPRAYPINFLGMTEHVVKKKTPH